MRRAVLLICVGVVASLVVVGTALAAEIMGTSGNDRLVGSDSADTMYGYEGNDTILGNGGADTIWSGAGADLSRGYNSADQVHGEGGNDTLEGQAGNDELRGGDGKDILRGGNGKDKLYDRGGDPTEVDEFYCGGLADTVYADSGDFVSSDCEVVDSGSQDSLPDLGMAQLKNIQIQTTTDGKRLLRFATTIVNVGSGNFQLTGRRPNTTTDMTVTQRIFDNAGGYRDRSTTAFMFYSGDGHSHWHVRDLEDYELFRSDGSDTGRKGLKIGFCFYDNVQYGASTPAYYLGCENHNPGALSVTMGLSRGWGDIYGADLVGQYIDITDLPDDQYRLKVTADGSDRFLEANETNNVTWVDLQIAGDSVTVLSHGPSAPRIG